MMPPQPLPKDEELAKRIAELEESIGKIREGYGELGQYLGVLREISGRYFRLMELYARHGAISADMAVPEVKDPISKEIIRILVEKSDKGSPGLNLSEITRELKVRRGTASRRIVRERVSELVGLGIVTKKEEGRQSLYEVSEGLIERWYRLLGLPRK